MLEFVHQVRVILRADGAAGLSPPERPSCSRDSRQAVLAGSRVYCHCFAGTSRAASVRHAQSFDFLEPVSLAVVVMLHNDAALLDPPPLPSSSLQAVLLYLMQVKCSPTRSYIGPMLGHPVSVGA